MIPNLNSLKDKISNRTFTENDLQGLTNEDLVELFKHIVYITGIILFEDIQVIINLLIDNLQTVDIEVTKDKGTILYWASTQGHTEIVQFLLSKNADVNKQSDSGSTALHQAAGKNKFDIVKLLIEAGARTDIKDDLKETAIDIAKGKIKQFLLDKQQKTVKEYKTLCDAITYGTIDQVRSIIEQGADINKKNELDMTPLIVAVLFQKPKAVKLLLEKGADISITDSTGKSPSELSTHFSNSEIITLLKKHEIDNLRECMHEIKQDQNEIQRCKNEIQKYANYLECVTKREERLTTEKKESNTTIYTVVAAIISIAIAIVVCVKVSSVKQNLKIAIPLLCLGVVACTLICGFIGSRCDKKTNILTESDAQCLNLQEQGL